MKYFISVFIMLSIVLNAQIYKFEYLFTSIEYPSNKVLEDSAVIITKQHSLEKIYQVSFGKYDTFLNSQNDIVLPRSQYQYYLYTKNGNQFFIHDFIQGKYYDLKDDIFLQWNIAKEYKIIDDIKLTKAITEFRGRKYTAWFKPSQEWQVAPWKFSGLPGIVYEVYDDQKQFHWQFVGYSQTKEKLKNPFEKTQQFIPYQKYPKLRYGLSEELEKALGQNPNRTIFEQPRVDLEIKFKWEQ